MRDEETKNVRRQVTILVSPESRLAQFRQVSPGILGYLVLLGDQIARAQGETAETLAARQMTRSPTKEKGVPLVVRIIIPGPAMPLTDPLLWDQDLKGFRAPYVMACLDLVASFYSCEKIQEVIHGSDRWLSRIREKLDRKRKESESDGGSFFSDPGEGKDPGAEYQARMDALGRKMAEKARSREEVEGEGARKDADDRFQPEGQVDQGESKNTEEGKSENTDSSNRQFISGLFG